MHLQSTVTLVGNLVDDVTYRTAGDSTVATFRLACSNGYRDRRQDRWVETTTYLRVSAWRQLGENAVASLAKGQPVVVVGRLRQREYENDGRRITVVDVEADFIGHDLNRGVAAFRRNARGPQTADLAAREPHAADSSEPAAAPAVEAEHAA
jgi:single-strand DNA-binding protein